MINLHSCITVYKKKNEGALEEAGDELMVKGTKKIQHRSADAAGSDPK